jgi:ABC-type transport system involved in multi-copper enzyme maturation permease subunit
MSLGLLFTDELRGFYRSKVMLFLWAGLPAVAVLMHLWAPGTGELPLTALTGLLVSTLSGTLAAVMLVASIVSERERHVYDLFVIRPVRRRDILLGKFLAVYVCVSIAVAIAIGLGLVIDTATSDVPLSDLMGPLAGSLITSFSALAVTAAAGVLIGIAAPSIIAGVVLVIYGANQIGGLIAAAGALYLKNDALTLALGASITVVLMGLAIYAFDRKQL